MHLKLITIFLLFLPITTYGITFDSNISTLSVKNKNIRFISYISPSEIDYILRKNNIEINSYEDHILNKDILQNYYTNNIKINNNCNLNNFDLVNIEEYINTIHQKGLRIELNYKCETKVNNLFFQINTFKDFQNQKYSISIYNQNKSNNKILYKVLDKNNNFIKIDDLKKFNNIKTKDSDCDGLNDEEEKIYGTNLFKQDTDGDNYSDFEEVQASLEPLNKILGPGQTYRESLPYISCQTKNIPPKEDNFFSKIISKILNFLKK